MRYRRKSKKRNGTKVFLLAAVVVAVLAASWYFRVPPQDEEAEAMPLNAEEIQTEVFGVIGDNFPVSRAMAAKMLALMLYGMNEIDALEIKHSFSDVAAEAWYTKYVNAVFSMGIMLGGDGLFLPDEPLTLSQAQSLLNKLNPEGRRLSVAEENRDRPISYALWAELFKSMLEELSGENSIGEKFGIYTKNMIILETGSGLGYETENEWLTSGDGVYGHTGLQMSAYIDTEISVLVKDGEIVALNSLISVQPVLKNAYILNSGKEGITIFCGGAERYYPYAESYEENQQAEMEAGTICDIVISGGEALSVSAAEDLLTGTVLRVSGNFVELKNIGILALDTDFRVYSAINDMVQRREPRNLIVGSSAVFFLRDNIVCAGIITSESDREMIRVVISASDYSGYLHKSVTVTSDSAFSVSAGGSAYEYEAGQSFIVSDIENRDLFGLPRIFITAAPGGTLQLSGVTRSGSGNENPRYRGVIEISRANLSDAENGSAGGYLIVNELTLEEYLYAVVPSEMPSSYGVESSKVQAVTARSYAVNQLKANRFHELGGNVDDSVQSQVYNNIPENEISIRAVNETRGELLWFEGNVVSANYFSTSSGHTANSGDVWAVNGVFPAETPEYLRARPQSENAVGVDLSNEFAAAQFFKTMDARAYESIFPWFRWQVEMRVQELTASINAQLSRRYQADNMLIKVYDKRTGAIISPESGIGDLLDMTVLRRGEGGNIMELKLYGSAGEAVIITEYNVRVLLAPNRAAGAGARDIPIERGDGSVVYNYALMPSAFFTFDKVFGADGKLESVIFYGGGNGHGVGMSQNGVKVLTDAGYNYPEILRYFYPGTRVGD